MRNRLIHCLDALFIGMILGLLFVTLIHASPAPHSEYIHFTHAMAPSHHCSAPK